MPIRRARLGHLDCIAAEPEGESRGLPLLLLHGLGGGAWCWEGMQRRLAEMHGRRSYAAELPYHAHLPGLEADGRLGDFSVETFALFAAGTMEAIGNCFVAGHSMGGLMAQKLAESFDRAGYIFLSSAPPWHMFRRAYWPLWRWALRQPVRLLLHSLNQDPVLFSREMEDELINHRLPAELRGAVYARDVPDSGRALVQMCGGRIYVDESQIHSACIAAAGSDDRLIPLSEQRRLAAKYQCPLEIFDRGHMLPIEPGWEEIADWLAGWCATREGQGIRLA